jgi:seryl-tRNA synthetase
VFAKMLELKLIRKNPEIVRKSLEQRRDTEKIEWLKDLLEKDEAQRKNEVEIEKLRHDRNTATMKIRELKQAGKEDEVKKELEKAKKIPLEIERMEKENQEIEEKIKYYLMRFPNILDETVPYGKSDEDNVTIKTWGEKTSFKFQPKSHVDLIEGRLAYIDKAAEVSGARFFYLKGNLALLDIVLMHHVLEKMSKKGYVPIEPPFMLHKKYLEGATDLKEFEDVVYKIENEDLYLISTSEHPLVAMMANTVIKEEDLPLKFAGFSPCFRKEAGAHGKDTKGIFRDHQFNKIEQFIYCTPEQSKQFHEEMLKNAEEVFQELKIPYRVVNICTGDIGIVASKKYDIEAWMPVQNAYREVVSCSNCTSYQTVRSNIKYVDKSGEKRYPHTLNSTAIATQRALVAIIENYQTEDGRIRVPDVLKKYFGKDYL